MRAMPTHGYEDRALPALGDARAEVQRLEARWFTLWENFEAVRETDASPQHVAKVHALLVELAESERDLAAARLRLWREIREAHGLVRRWRALYIAIIWAFFLAVAAARGCVGRPSGDQEVLDVARGTAGADPGFRVATRAGGFIHVTVASVILRGLVL